MSFFYKRYQARDKRTSDRVSKTYFEVALGHGTATARSPVSVAVLALNILWNIIALAPA